MRLSLRKYYELMVQSVLIIFSLYSIVFMILFITGYIQDITGERIQTMLWFVFFALIVISAGVSFFTKKSLSVVVADDIEVSKGKYSFVKGASYVIEENRPTKSLDILNDAVKHGWNALCFTRTYPNHFEEMVGSKRMTTIWLTETETKNVISPSELEEIYFTFNNFITKNKNGIIYLDCFEYLVSNSDFQKVLHLIQDFVDDISNSDSCLILSLNPSTMSKIQLNLIEYEFSKWSQ